MVVEIRDSGLPPLSSTAVVTVDIEDVNDCPPLFSESSYNATVQVRKQQLHTNIHLGQTQFFLKLLIHLGSWFSILKRFFEGFWNYGNAFVIFQCCWCLSKTFFFNLEFVWTETTNRNCKFHSQLRKYIFLRDFSWHVHLQNFFFFANIPCLTQFLLLTKVFFL